MLHIVRTAIRDGALAALLMGELAALGLALAVVFGPRDSPESPLVLGAAMLAITQFAVVLPAVVVGCISAVLIFGLIRGLNVSSAAVARVSVGVVCLLIAIALAVATGYFNLNRPEQWLSPPLIVAVLYACFGAWCAGRSLKR